MYRGARFVRSLWAAALLAATTRIPGVEGQCAAGEFGASASSCTECPVGKYADAPDTQQCLLCAAGKWLNSKGSTSAADCNDCEAGKSSEPGNQYSFYCGPCEVGKYTAGAERTCTPCGAGRYAEGYSGRTSGAGSGSASDTNCIDCDAGTYAEGALNTHQGSEIHPCTDCSAGQYAAAASASCSDGRDGEDGGGGLGVVGWAVAGIVATLGLIRFCRRKRKACSGHADALSLVLVHPSVSTNNTVDTPRPFQIERVEDEDSLPLTETQFGKQGTCWLTTMEIVLQQGSGLYAHQSSAKTLRSGTPVFVDAEKNVEGVRRIRVGFVEETASAGMPVVFKRTHGWFTPNADGAPESAVLLTRADAALRAGGERILCLQRLAFAAGVTHLRNFADVAPSVIDNPVFDDTTSAVTEMIGTLFPELAELVTCRMRLPSLVVVRRTNEQGWAWADASDYEEI